MLPLIVALLSTAAEPGRSYLADIGPAAAVRLVDADRRPFDLASRRDKVVVVSFIYTTCTGSCPITTARLVQTRKALREAGLWGDRVEFVSISLDPERDTSEALKRYADLRGADDPAWHFLTGETAEVDATVRAWDMWARTNAAGVLDHPSRIFLIDPKGRRREIYNLELLDPATLVKDVRSLLGEWR